MSEQAAGFHAPSSDCLARSCGSAQRLSSRALGWQNCEMGFWDFRSETYDYQTYEDVILALHLDREVDIALRIDGRGCEYRSLPGMVTLVPPGVEVSFTPRTDFRCYLLHLPADLIKVRPHLASYGTKITFLRFGCDVNLRQMMSVLLNELNSPSSCGRDFVQALSSSIALYLNTRLQDHMANVGTPREAQLMSQIDRTVDEQIESTISAERLAQLVGLTKSRLSCLIRDTTGMSPHRYVTNRRVALAEFMLRNSLAPLSEIALSCGFSSQSHFTEVFHKTRGITPSQFRKRAN